MLNYQLDAVVKCKYCGQKEFWGKMTWLDGRELCRDCYNIALQHRKFEYSDQDRVNLCR